MHKKLIWDRQYHNDLYNNGDEEDTSSEEDGDEQPINAQQYDDGSRRRVSNWRSTGVDLPNRPAFNQDLSERLDRNYGAFFGTSSPSTQGVRHRNVPTEYFSREQLDDQFEAVTNVDLQFQRRMDVVEADRSTGRTFGDDAPGLEFQTIPRKVSNDTADSADRLDYLKNGKEKAVFEMPGRFRRVYSKWSKWSKCSAKCITKRLK